MERPEIRTHLSQGPFSSFLTHFILSPAHAAHALFRGCRTRFFDDSGESIIANWPDGVPSGGGTDGGSIVVSIIHRVYQHAATSSKVAVRLSHIDVVFDIGKVGYRMF